MLNIIAVDRNFGGKKVHTQLMDVFAKLGSTNEAVKKGRKKLASIMFWGGKQSDFILRLNQTYK